MCNYCKVQETAEIPGTIGFFRKPSGRIPICSEDLDFGICGWPIINIYIDPNGCLKLIINNFGRGDKTWKHLCKIEYCPMCGRKLLNTEHETKGADIND